MSTQVRTIVALLTGRGNNTLKDKNILDCLGHPLLHYPAFAARKSRLVTNWYCSSDDEKIFAAAEAEGYKRIVRPARLASPMSQHVECILHGVEEMAKDGIKPEIIVVLLANNVTVKTEWIDDCIQMMLDDASLSAVVPVYEGNDHHSLRAKLINSEGLLVMYEKNVHGKLSTNRQDLTPCYFLAHNFWVLRNSALADCENGQPPWSFMGNRIKSYVIGHTIDIHGPRDLIIAADWVKRNL